LRFIVLALFLAACGGDVGSPVTAPVGGLSVRVDPAGAHLQIMGPDGKLLLDGIAGSAASRTSTPRVQELFGSFLITEKPPAWQPVAALHNVRTSDGGIVFDEGQIMPLGDAGVQLTLHLGGNRATLAFACDAQEHFIGFGAQKYDVDHRGQTVPLFVSEQGIGSVDTDDPPADWFLEGTRHSSYFPVPFFVSSRGYGVLAETSERAVFAMCSEESDRWRAEVWEGTLTLDVFAGPTPADVLRRFTDQVGRPDVPPPFAFAPWNDAIHGSANVRRVAGVLRANQIPSSIIWTEDWGGGLQMGDNYNLQQNWSVDRTLYPDIEQVAADLHAQNFKFLAYFSAFAIDHSDHFDTNFLMKDATGAPVLLDWQSGGKTGLADLVTPAAQDWVASHLQGALALGFDGWMADYGEWAPFGDTHNLYPIEWQKLNERVLGDDDIDFVRSGWLGSQPIRHQVVWGGDQSTDFDVGDGLPTAIPIGIGLGICGMPYYGSDVGGYMTWPGKPFRSKELFFRWTTLGALSPIMRTHHGVADAMNWSFESDAETIAHFKRWAQLHMQLYPYFQAAAQDAHTSGMPILRALALGFPDDAAAWPIKDEYLLGPRLLVAPVITEGATSRDVYFPAGHWVPLDGGTPQDGPMTATIAAPLTEIPAYARAGTVIDLLPASTQSLIPTVPPAGELRAYLGASDDPRLSSTQPPTGAGPLLWNGTPLAACGTPPCGAVDVANRRATAQLTGAGTLSLEGSTLQVDAADAVVTLYW
jgi:sulfoquinovosidase